MEQRQRGQRRRLSVLLVRRERGRGPPCTGRRRRRCLASPGSGLTGSHAPAVTVILPASDQVLLELSQSCNHQEIRLFLNIVGCYTQWCSGATASVLRSHFCWFLGNRVVPRDGTQVSWVCHRLVVRKAPLWLRASFRWFQQDLCRVKYCRCDRLPLS